MESMTPDVKKALGISNSDYDTIIDNYVKAGVLDLKQVGLIDSKVVTTDALIYSAVMSYCLSLLDDKYSELHTNAYALQKDTLRHLTDYITDDEE